MEGEWRDIIFKPVLTKEDFKLVLKHLSTTFYIDEPIKKVLGAPTKERVNDIDARVLHALNDKLSFVAVDQNTKEMVGCLINTHCAKDSPPPQQLPTSPMTKAVRTLMTRMYNQMPSTIHVQFGVDAYAEIFIVSVSQEWRGKGLASEMYRRGINYLTQLGYTLIVSEFSNPLSRKIGEKFGFKEISRVNFLDAKDEEGNIMIPNATADQYVTLTVLDIK